MGSLYRSAASLGFYGDELNPAELTARLGRQPTVGVIKGGTWLTSIGAEKVAITGSWRLRVERREPADLDSQINELLDAMTNDLATWRYFAEQFRGRLFCGLFLSSGNEGVTFGAETVSRIGERKLLLDVDIYGQETLN